ncbi:hypothetical protein AB0878_46820 [Amycolatopsis sp. NPDC047767]|uniref:hypothetical protein n=1 Tax=Amycolatopsis sp. NPDC047767 TaxID=3156765 RepID=UPI0034552237
MTTTLPLAGRARLRALPTSGGAIAQRGTAGLGKTTLLTELTNTVAEHQHETEAAPR